jgi:hypothetical protein
MYAFIERGMDGPRKMKLRRNVISRLRIWKRFISVAPRLQVSGSMVCLCQPSVFADIRREKRRLPSTVCLWQGEPGKGLRNDVIVVGARNSARNELDPQGLEHQKTCYSGGEGGKSGPSVGNEHVIAA